MEYAKEFAMKAIITPATAAGLILAAALPAQAQTVITPTPLNTSVQTVRTTETVRTIRPRGARREVVTTRTVTQQVVPAVPTTTVIARTVPATTPPLYDTVAPVVPSSDTDYGPPLYDTVAPVTSAAVGPSTSPFIYRYVYEPDRILVIDPTTNIAVQSIPR
jgi:hypothetical protein